MGESARGEASSSDRPSTSETTGRFDSQPESEFSEGARRESRLGSPSQERGPAAPRRHGGERMSTSSSLKPNRLKRNVPSAGGHPDPVLKTEQRADR